MNRIQWRKIQIYITTKNTSEFKDQQVSIMKLVALLQTLDKQFKIQRYKGLGSMKPEDKASTCMDPERRNMHRITSVGDVALIFNLLGNDPAARKKLLSRN
jgi:DNA gyrase/topoisomerase IV subunit B